MPHRPTVILAAALLAGLTCGCAQLTTTGVPYEEGPGGDGGSEADNTLAGTAWVLQDSTLEGEAIDAEVTIAFEEAALTGRAPVNSYFGGYSIEGELIEIGEIGVTLMAGPEPLMEAETMYLALLGSVQRFEVGEDLLLLEADDGEFLAYEPLAETGAGAGHGGDFDIPAETTALAESLIGLTVQDAQAAATDAGLGFRVVSNDGEALLVTMDYRIDRVNVDVQDGEVVDARVG